MAAVNIDRKIGGTDAQMPEVKQTPERSTNTPVNATYESTEPHPEPVPRKIRKPGTGGFYQISENLWERRFTPTNAQGKREAHNVYAKTREECEQLLNEMIVEVRQQIQAEKEQMKGMSL